jgi:hypothetical protein
MVKSLYGKGIPARKLSGNIQNQWELFVRDFKVV